MRKISQLFLIFLLTTLSFGLDLNQLQLNGLTGLSLSNAFQSKKENPKSEFSVNLEGFDLLFNLQLEERIRFASNVVWEPDTQYLDNFGNFGLAYVFAEHVFADEVKIRAGKYFTPFGTYNELRRAKLAYPEMEIPQSISSPEKLTQEAYPLFPFTSTGLMFLGETVFEYNKALEYQLSFSNGFSQDLHVTDVFDQNAFKAITALIRFDFIHSWKIDKSFYIDYIPGNKYGLLFVDGYGLQFRGEFWGFQSSFVNAILEEQNSNIKIRKNQKAFHIQVSRSIRDTYTPYLGFEWLDPHSRGFKNNLLMYTLGTQMDLGEWYVLKSEMVFHQFNSKNLKLTSETSYLSARISILAGF